MTAPNDDGRCPKCGFGKASMNFRAAVPEQPARRFLWWHSAAVPAVPEHIELCCLRCFARTKRPDLVGRSDILARLSVFS